MTAPLPQGELTIERMCALAGVSRAGYLPLAVSGRLCL